MRLINEIYLKTIKKKQSLRLIVRTKIIFHWITINGLCTQITAYLIKICFNESDYRGKLDFCLYNRDICINGNSSSDL